MHAATNFAWVLFGCLAPVAIWLLIPLMDRLRYHFGELEQSLTLWLSFVFVLTVLNDR